MNNAFAKNAMQGKMRHTWVVPFQPYGFFAAIAPS